jgi:hypothetical protein
LIAQAVEQQQEGEKIHDYRLCDERPSSNGLRMIKSMSKVWWDQMHFAINRLEIYKKKNMTLKPDVECGRIFIKDS